MPPSDAGNAIPRSMTTESSQSGGHAAIWSRSVVFLGNVLVGVVGHQRSRDNADDRAEQNVQRDDVADPVAASSAVAINGAGPPEMTEES